MQILDNPVCQGILKKYRFDMPPGIENNRADWKKLVTSVQESFTARRAAWKKTVCFIIVTNKPVS